MTKPNVFTAVFREVTPDEVGEITHHPKWSAGSWSHALDDRKEAEAAIQAENARIAELEADLSFQKQVTDAARQNQAELLGRAETAEVRIAELQAQIATEDRWREDSARYNRILALEWESYARECSKAASVPIDFGEYKRRHNSTSDVALVNQQDQP
jgi:vacuolar-type H+-ATPase subunit I/STV1